MQAIKLSCSHHIPQTYFNQFNAIVRSAHNRFLEDDSRSLSEVEKLIKTMNLPLMDASFIKMAVNKAKSLPKEKIIFARKQFRKLKYHKIDKQDYLKAKNSTILLRGSKADNNGNRKAQLDLANNQILFKPAKGISFPIQVNNDRRLKQLKQLQSLCESGTQGFTLEIGHDHVSIIFDESVFAIKQKQLKHDRVLAIDMNPNYIGLVIKNQFITFHKEIIDLRELNKVNNKHKKLHETAHIALRLIELAIHYQCSVIAYEQLEIKTKDHGKGRRYNKLVNNSWNRAKFIQILNKHCVLNGIKALPIHAAYSSFIGCMMYPDDIDSIAAAIEIHRRAMDYIKSFTYKIFPEMELSDLTTRWKEMLNCEISSLTWKELYVEWKSQPGLSYRLLFDNRAVEFSFSLRSDKSMIKCHVLSNFG